MYSPNASHLNNLERGRSFIETTNVNVNATQYLFQLRQPGRAVGAMKVARIVNSVLESLRASVNEEITSEIKNLLIESQREMLKLLKPKTRENSREEDKNDIENETRVFYIPTKSARINSTQNNHPCRSRNNDYEKSGGAYTNQNRESLGDMCRPSSRCHHYGYKSGQSELLTVISTTDT